MPGFVLDASITLGWRLADESDDFADILLSRLEAGVEAFVPAHWPLEVTNALLTALRRGRVTSVEISQFIEDLDALPIHIEPASTPQEWPAIVALAETHHLTAYDAAYPELARRKGLPLASNDKALTKAAEAEGVALVKRMIR